MPDLQTVRSAPPALAGAAVENRSRFTPDQRAAISGRHPEIALSAGAGSGKTTVLVERFLSLVAEGIAPANILAVTFTEKAAAEMKERIVQRFEESGQEENRRQTEVAYISTIHGLCARLLRENPLAARLDPGFGIMDGMTRGIFLDEALQRLYEDAWFRGAVERLGADDGTSYPQLFELIRDAALKPREFGTDAPAEADFTLEQHVAQAMERLDDFCGADWGAARQAVLGVADAIFEMQIRGDKHGPLHAEMCAVLRALDSSHEIDAGLARRFLASTGFTGSAGKHPAIGAVRAAFELGKTVFKRYSTFDRGEEERLEREVIAPLKVGIYQRAAKLREEYDAFKRAHGLLDFEDLQARALELLDEPHVRQEYTGRFSHLLLDEAQDTNPVQMRIIARLRGENAHLFSVGDLKQAIYAFRGADVDLFRGLYEAAGAGRMSLAENFRSRAEILDLVNAVGEQLWADGSVPFEELRPGLPYPATGEGPRLELCLLTKGEVEREEGEEGKESKDEVRLREGALLARWIRDAVEGTAERGPLQVLDPATKEMRPLRYADIAILTRTRTPVPLYEHCLSREGIPYVTDGGRGFFAGLEVTDVLNALRVLVNPLDDAALLAVLRSPLFAWRDADLVRLRQAAGKRALWQALREGFAPAAAESSPRAYQLLASLRAWSSALTPALLIERLLQQTHYRAALLQTPTGRAQVANLGKLVEFARSCADLDGPSLARFVERATLAGRHLADESDAALASPEDDVVTVSTIHGAKGLEWPVVLLPSLDTDFAGTRSGTGYSAPDGALLINPHDARGETIRPRSNRVLEERMRQRDQAEARRIFYVALTRAREYLVMSGQVTYSKKTDLARFTQPIEWLAKLCGLTEHESGCREVELGQARLRLSFRQLDERPATALEPDPLDAAREQVRRGEPVSWGENLELVGPDEISQVIESIFGAGISPLAAPPALTTTVTRLAYYYRCPRVYYYDLVLQIEEHPRARRRSAGGEAERLTPVDLGTRVHALLERAQLDADPGVEAARLATAETSIGEGDRERMRKMLHNVLADPLMERARGAPRLEREYPFHLELEGSVVQGVIDLVFTDSEGKGVVLDYKSNDLTAPDRVNVLTRYYRPQIELYALAAQRAGLTEPGEATLYFLNGPVARPLPVDGERLERIEAEASTTLTRIARQDWETEPGEKCRSCGYRKRGFCEVGRQWKDG